MGNFTKIHSVVIKTGHIYQTLYMKTRTCFCTYLECNTLNVAKNKIDVLSSRKYVYSFEDK
jgi:hypothetical protein